MLTVAPSGRTKLATSFETPRLSSAHSIVTGSVAELDEVENEISSGAPANEPLVKQDLLSLPLREAREQFERAYLQQQLVLCDGKVGQLAKRVGMERTHLYRKLRSLGVDFKSVGTDD